MRAHEVRAEPTPAYPEAGEISLDRVASALCDASSGPDSFLHRNPRRQEHPSAAVVAEVVEALRSVFFPGYFGISEVSIESMRFHVGATLDRAVRDLREQIRRGLCFECRRRCPGDCDDCRAETVTMTRSFVERLPEIRRLLSTDVCAAYEGDPAAQSPDEAIFCYPGIRAAISHRIAHELYRIGVPLIPRIISEQAHGKTGIDIHPGATIGERFFIDHGTGVVIGETCVIGDGVRLYQGVTLGAKSFPLGAGGNPVKGIPRHPVVEDDVIIYSGATILGRVTIGRGAVIGGNVWLTRSVPPGSRITQVQARQEMFDQGGGI